MDCRVCSTPDEGKPQIFRGEEFCCDRHKKVIAGEVEPNHTEWITMNRDLYLTLGGGCRE